MPVCPRCQKSWAAGLSTCPEDGAVLQVELPVEEELLLRRGQTIGEYVIEAHLGGGTFGEVYRGIQPLIGKQVAVKVLSKKYSADPGVVSRFIAEARAVNQIRHKNIIDIFSFGQLADGRHYHVMELLEGSSLEAHLAGRGRLELPELLEVLRPLGRALDAAHAAGIAHRDLKPANVFLARTDDGRLLPKLLDFGVAKLLTDELPRAHHTATGAAVGTPDYMSPEQCQGAKIDHRADIYSFGVMTYQLLTGRLPFRGQNVVEVLIQHVREPPPPPSEVAPGAVHPAFDAPLLAMMAKDRYGRPASLASAVRSLELAAEQAGVPIPPARSGEGPSPAARAFSERILSSGPGSGAAVSGPRTPVPLPEESNLGTADTLKRRTPTVVPALVAPRRRWRLAALLALPVLLAMGLLYRPAARSPAAVVTPPRAVPTTTAAAATSTRSAGAASPPTVRVAVLSVPPGATVVGPGGVVLGTTPFERELPRGGERVRLLIQARGYRSETHEVSTAQDSRLELVLRRVPRDRPRPGSDELEPAFP